jgi:hypothetical protein
MASRSKIGPATMLPSGMTTRPADLPDYEPPPVAQVVLGVQFNGLEHFLSTHLGLVWDVFKHEFPIAEEHPYFPPQFETFGTSAAFVVPGVNFQIISRPEMARVHFVDRDRRQLLRSLHFRIGCRLQGLRPQLIPSGSLYVPATLLLRIYSISYTCACLL